MAYYAYKTVQDLLPDFIIKKMGEEYEGGADYDGDQWIAASNYIEYLQELVKKYSRDRGYDFDKEEL